MIKHIRTYSIAASLFVATLCSQGMAQECTDTILDNTPLSSNGTDTFTVHVSPLREATRWVVPETGEPRVTFTFTTYDAVVEDKRTELLWQRCPYPQFHDIVPNSGEGRCFFNNNGEEPGEFVTTEGYLLDTDFTYRFDEAIRLPEYANAESHGGYSDGWRLPNIKELFSLVSSRCTDPALNTELFPNNPTDSEGTCYWSSTPDRYDDPVSMFFWTVNFQDGTIDSRLATITEDSRKCHVRLVRDID